MASIWKSLTDIWKSLSFAQRATLAGSAALTAAGLMLIVWFSQKQELSLLYGGLDAAEAGKITDELREQKIAFELGNGGRSIRVPSKMVYELRLKLASKGIPKGGSGGSGIGFEIFDKPTFGLSDFLQKANYYRALQGELARTISQMEEVESARVLIVTPNERLFAAEKTESKASVFLQLRSQARLQRQQINAIRFLVANGVEGLKPSNVAIIDNSGNLLAENDENSASGLSSSQLEARKMVENLYAGKVQSMFDQVLGPQQAVVRVTVDMDFDTKQQTEERFDPSSQVVRNETLQSEDATNPIRTSTSSPGTSSNNAPGVEGASQAKTEEKVLVGTSKKSNVTNQYEINKIVQSTLKGVGELKKVSVAVFINQRTEGSGAARKAIPRTATEKALLENVIKKAVGFVEEGKGKRNDELALEEIPFAAAAEPVEAPLTEKIKSDWVPYIKDIILAALALGLILYFRKILNSAKTERLSLDLALERSLAAHEDHQALTASSMLAPPSMGPVTVGELSKLIRENPTNMASALKKWIS